MDPVKKSLGILAVTALSMVAGLAVYSALMTDAAAASNRFRCEYRPVPNARSKIDIDATGLTPGTYSAEVTSNGGVNIAYTAAQQAINGEVQFGFDSHDEVGETLLEPRFIVGLKASGRVVDSQGNTVFSVSNVSCRKHN